jgi:uncharacterized protein
MSTDSERSKRELTGPYWAAVDRGELVRPVCRSCDKSFFTPQVVCPGCQQGDWSYELSSGKGRVHSYSTVHRPPDPRFAPPLVIADVQMDEGWRLMTWIVECDPAEVEIDMRVVVRFVPGPDGELLPAFEPERAAP